MAPVIKELERDSYFEVFSCVTAQHRQMLDQVLDIFGVNPDFDLNIMKDSQTLADITSRVLDGIYEVLKKVKPDVVLVHGDTSTTFSASLAAFYHKIKVGHVEAGLRTGDLSSPWPEEMNRKLTAGIATYHFAPTIAAQDNLLIEGVSGDNIIVTGNSVIDALLLASARIENFDVKEKLDKHFSFLNKNKKMILVTGHRRENFGMGFEEICSALKKLSCLDGVEIVYPVHMNPCVREPVNRILGDVRNIYLIEPQEYLQFVYLLNRSYLVVTDSGGVQEEAPTLGKPVLVMRSNTERPEAVEAGTVKLVGTDSERIYAEAERLIVSDRDYFKMQKAVNPYGDGLAAKRIVRFLKDVR
jgi:UDP-N-acetylglucosamine 2-epimerase (non-hydrolysing)